MPPKSPNPAARHKQAGVRLYAHELRIYVAPHCEICAYARQVAQALERDYPALRVVVVNLEDDGVEVPDSVFATPTYLLDGRVWSLGNPSPLLIIDTFGPVGSDAAMPE